jgi:tetratricopeptide (TPR) repeat protein
MTETLANKDFERIPVLTPGIELTAYNLEPLEGFLISRLDGVSSVAVLAGVVAMSVEELNTRVERLVNEGLLYWKDPVQPAAAKPAQTVELEVGDQVRLKAAETLLRSCSLWELFGVIPTSTSGDLKQAYFSISKLYHPDCFYGRELGEFAEFIESTFQRIKEGYEILSSAERRREYAATEPPPERVGEAILLLSPDVMRAMGNQPGRVEESEKRRRLEARRREIVDQRRKKRTSQPNPSNDKLAKDIYQRGIAALRHGEVEEAAKHFKMAVTYAPTVDEYRTLYEETSTQARGERSRRLMAMGAEEYDLGFAATAAQHFGEAADLMPTMGSYAFQASQAYLAAGDIANAAEYADRAVAASPNRKEFRLAAAAAFQGIGEMEVAREHLQVVAALDEEDDRAKDLLRKLNRNDRVKR